MNNVILFDDESRDHLLPLTFTRPIGQLRIGILTIREKWERWLNARISFITQDYLAEKFPIHIEEDNFVINGSVLPSDRLCRLILQLETNEALLDGGELIAARLNRKQFDRLINDDEIEELQGIDLEDTPFLKIKYPWDVFRLNDQALREDFDLLTENRESEKIADTNRIIAPDQIFIEKGATVSCAVLNASTGPIYIGKDATVMEGAMIRGPFALGDHSQVKMGGKIYGATTLGPHCKVGGEVSNTVFQGYSSKAHDGYIGNSVIGEWCNLGADTNCSNLKNNYAEVRVWNYPEERFIPTGLQFCGLIMGDHSKSGINTMFNTGTVVGVFANIFGAGFPRNFIPSFAWGGYEGYSTYHIKKAFEVAERVMSRRDLELSTADRAMIEHVFGLTSPSRRWDKTEA